MVDRISIVTDLGYGDSGKGAFVDYLCAKEGNSLVIRNNGGANAGHNVVTPNGKHHCFSQFGSGTLVGAATYLGPNMLVSPMYLWNETKTLAAKGINEAHELLMINRHCRVITPYHELLNRVRETMRGNARHGSCGYGVGELMTDTISTEVPVLTIDDIANSCSANPAKIQGLRDKLYLIWYQKAQIIKELSGQILENFDNEIIEFYKFFTETFDFDWYGNNGLHSLLKIHDHIVFEGAQGVMIDETYGFHPYTTWSDTTPRPAHAMIEEFLPNYKEDGIQVHNYGLLRAYSTRHGNGPFPSYSEEFTDKLADPHNPHNEWQGGFRAGPFDVVAARYALRVCKTVGYPIDSLVFSCLDQVFSTKVVSKYLEPTVGFHWNADHAYTVPEDNLDLRAFITERAKTVNPFTVEIKAKDSLQFVSFVAKYLAPISYTASGPTRNDRKPWKPLNI